MAVTVDERNIGRRKSLTSIERAWIIRGAADETEALEELLDQTPDSLDGFVRINNDCDVEEIEPNSGLFYGIVKWAANDWSFPQPNSFTYSFDVAGVNTHLTQSRLTVAKYPTATARDFKGAIGVNQDGSIEGCDVLIPALSWQMNYVLPEETIQDSYLGILMDTVGAVNTDTFKGFPAGELLLTRVTGQQRSDNDWDMTYTFAASPNATGLTVGAITGIAKKGWEYMWIYYEDQEVTVGSVKYVHKVPVSVYIEEVYRKIAYSGLGIS